MLKNSGRETGITIEYVERRLYHFVKQNGRWFMQLSEGETTDQSDLEMIAGADEILEAMARGRKRVSLEMDRTDFDGADLLELIDFCEAPKGGAHYLLHSYKGRKVYRKLWVCDVILFVFGDLPEKIFIKKLDYK